MAIHLIVTAPFANRNVGERIKDTEEVSKILASHQRAHVVRIEAPDEPKPTVMVTVRDTNKSSGDDPVAAK